MVRIPMVLRWTRAAAAVLCFGCLAMNCTKSSGGDAIAFKNTDGSIVTVMYNSGSSATYIVSVGGKKLQFSMPGNGWATVDYVP
jgi:O-glycosyl hydrolase